MIHVPQALKTTLTLLVLAGVLAVGAWWGWSSLTTPFDEDASADEGTCAPLEIARGDRVTPDMVEVVVLNSGNRANLASTVMEQLTSRGFVGVETGNSETEVNRVQVWAPTRRGPGIQMLMSSMPKGTKVRKRDVDTLTVVLGDGFTDLATGREAVKATRAGTLCQPAAS
ncbi:LytR C-terminal domain-containing protein [Nocardioides bruguierae]|uniref:LytR C-terminal domain-containing protein n=1 Tax=Nocardioides bruguierae TaxID=2945102 RepID=A0A9X2D7X3_9ACTN|nr:LytR C-terminal domain-containing protein [Nocardioides bruguierae]MCL8025517.1 LytR C-terminal domain-containing protein [Nocardioides bruguierae]MCL8027404.1 LytR C-terminal domain-containing protein [Nocardioides bruguierae]MCM0620674.1 LytR C-terminal domain-containing protein [Nocardioides bruguierae]